MSAAGDFALRPDDAEIRAAFDPFVQQGNWEAQATAQRRDVQVALRRRMLLGWLRRLRRNQKSVAQSYDCQWQDVPLQKQLSPAGPVVPCQWREQPILARAIGTKRVHLLHLFRAIESLQPGSVLEVGAGNGVNLIALAARFPALRLTGVELTAGGVEASRAVAELARLPEEVLAFLPQPARRESVAGAIDFRHGDARALPFGERAFDLVFTNLALEQMEEIRDAALREIARVAGAWVVMIEPFRDFNDEGIRRRYVRAQDYFSARVADLPRYGLEPVFVSADMPHKLTLKPAVVVARRT